MSDASVYPALLRSVADLIETHGLPHDFLAVGPGFISVSFFGSGASQEMAKWRRAVGGTWEKSNASYSDSRLKLAQVVAALPGSPSVELEIPKANCVRKVVGHEKVTVPAVEAQPERVEEREIVEWDCEPVLAGVDA